MTGTVADNALLLEVIAGADGLDPRQYAPETAAYTLALDRGAEGMRVGVVTEGFGQEFTEPDVDDAVREAIARLGRLGARWRRSRSPCTRSGSSLGADRHRGVERDGVQRRRAGDRLARPLREQPGKMHSAWRAHANSFSDTLKLDVPRKFVRN